MPIFLSYFSLLLLFYANIRGVETIKNESLKFFSPTTMLNRRKKKEKLKQQRATKALIELNIYIYNIINIFDIDPERIFFLILK